MLAQAAFDGIAYSGLYAMLGLAFFITFRVLHRFDLSFGTVVMASVYIAAMVCSHLDVPHATLLVALPLSIAVGVAVSVVSFRLVRGDPRFSMASTLGVWMVIEELVVQGPGFGRGQAVGNVLADSALVMGEYTVRADHVGVLVVAFTVAAGLYLSLHKTKLGLAIRVAAHDPDVAALMGMSRSRVELAATAIAAVVGCVAGYVFAASQQSIDVHFGMWATVKGLVILIVSRLQGIGSVLLAALALGAGERVATELLGVASRDLIGFGILALVLAATPRGLADGTNGAAR